MDVIVLNGLNIEGLQKKCEAKNCLAWMKENYRFRLGEFLETFRFVFVYGFGTFDLGWLSLYRVSLTVVLGFFSAYFFEMKRPLITSRKIINFIIIKKYFFYEVRCKYTICMISAIL